MRICDECLTRYEDAVERCPGHAGAGVGALLALGPGDDPRNGTLVGGDRFVVLGPIGKGGMGKVYRALQRSVRREVAIKVLDAEDSRDPEYGERFHREARAAAMLRSPHTVVVHEFGRL